jgi:hypothetical protein
VRFVDFLKTTVLACAAAATALGAVAIAGAAADDDSSLIAFCAGWWTVAAAIGIFLGRRAETTPPIARLLGEARATTTLPEQGRPGTVLLNRLWPLLLTMIGSGAVAFLVPQVPATAAGFSLILALYWRRQDAAVTAIEERDGAAFFVERTSPFKPIQLVRTPGFRRIGPAPSGQGFG